MKTLIIFFFLSVSTLLSAQNRNFTFVFLNRKADKAELPQAELAKVMAGHFANIERLAHEGKLLVAGPFEGGGGIFIFNSTSTSEVKEWLSSDPGVQANRWDIEILPYTSRVGSVCLVQKPFEMVNYEFIRYITNITKYNVQQAPELAHKHDDYLKELIRTGNVVAEGIFGEDGGILVMKGDLQKAVIEGDPSLAEGLYQIEFKKLGVAKGAFCEK